MIPTKEERADWREDIIERGAAWFFSTNEDGDAEAIQLLDAIDELERQRDELIAALFDEGKRRALISSMTEE
jgi:hypothetical protein